MAFLDFLKERASSSKTTLDMFFARLYPSIELPNVDLQGKRALVTGANVGIGREAALELAKRGAEVWLLCRNAKKAEDARAEIVKETGNSNVFVEVINLSSLESVRAFTDKWGTRTPGERKIDMLYNNAGLTTATRQTTSEGFELSYVTNFLSQFLLTTLLLHRGDFAPNARIVQCSSLAAFNSGPLTPEDVNSVDLLGKLKEGDQIAIGPGFKVYGRSKAMQIIFSRELAEALSRSSQWSDVVVHSCHPGEVLSSLWERPEGVAAYVVAAKILGLLNAVIGISPAEGARVPVWLLTSPEAAKPEVRGKFWDRTIWRWTPAWMEDANLRRALWKKWEEDAGVEASF